MTRRLLILVAVVMIPIAVAVVSLADLFCDLCDYRQATRDWRRM